MSMKREDSSDDWDGLDTAILVVGIFPGQSRRIIHEAARLGVDTGSRIVFVHVRVTGYLAEWDSAHDRREEQAHPVPHDTDGVLIAELERACSEESLLDDVSWTLRLVDGDPVNALIRVAEEVSADRLVVGSRARGSVAAIEEWLSHSVAARLVHVQSRPVLVVPAVGASAG